VHVRPAVEDDEQRVGRGARLVARRQVQPDAPLVRQADRPDRPARHARPRRRVRVRRRVGALEDGAHGVALEAGILRVAGEREARRVERVGADRVPERDRGLDVVRQVGEEAVARADRARQDVAAPPDAVVAALEQVLREAPAGRAARERDALALAAPLERDADRVRVDGLDPHATG
jgi:hypothetical protein